MSLIFLLPRNAEKFTPCQPEQCICVCMCVRVKHTALAKSLCVCVCAHQGKRDVKVNVVGFNLLSCIHNPLRFSCRSHLESDMGNSGYTNLENSVNFTHLRIWVFIF
jgi:hypothetical protein